MSSPGGLTETYLIVGLLPVVLIGFVASQAKNALMDMAFSELAAVRQIKENQIVGYFDHLARAWAGATQSSDATMTDMEQYGPPTTPGDVHRSTDLG